jgi:hypothetical protein
MAEALPEIVRTVSGKGVITLPEDYSSALQIYLYVQVLREPLTPSRNLTWNPDKSFYAHITFCIDDFVLRTEDVNFNNQVYEVHNGQSSQNLLSLICAYDGILDSFVSVGNVIGVTLSRVNLIKSHPFLRSHVNRIRFECFSSTALRLTLKGTALDKCDPQDGTSTPPPPPPPPVPPVPPGEPVEVSPPEEGSDDGGDTVPFPIDEMEPTGDLPFGEECLLYKVTGELVDVNGPGSGNSAVVFTAQGVIQDIFIRPDTTPGLTSASLRCICGGEPGNPCVQGTDVEIQSGFDNRASFILFTVELA